MWISAQIVKLADEVALFYLLEILYKFVIFVTVLGLRSPPPDVT